MTTKFKIGDVVTALHTYGRQFTKGKQYTVCAPPDSSPWASMVFVTRDDRGSKTNGWLAEHFELAVTPVAEFKVGDRARIVKSYDAKVIGKEGFITKHEGNISFLSFDIPMTDRAGWWFSGGQYGSHAVKIGASLQKDTFTLGNPSIADDLRLTNQGRKILAHLKRGQTISPLEAQAVYGVYSLAGRIFEIRGAGYKVNTKLKEDASGHRYARYNLVA